MTVGRRVLYASDFADRQKSPVKTYFLLMGLMYHPGCGSHGAVRSVRPLLVVCRK